MKIILISCASKKKQILEGEILPAKELYVGALFEKAWSYANKLNPDRIYILSAKYGLISPNKQIGHYNETLLKYPVTKQIKWSENVLLQLKKEGCNLEEDEFILLAGKVYYKYLLGNNGIKKYQLPYNGFKGIGFILNFLTGELQNGNMENINSIKNIRSSFLKRNSTIKALPGIYCWWFLEDGAMKIINQLPNIDINMIKKREINEQTYFALYFGISKNLRERIEWHTCQSHTMSSVNSGFLSTLRQTLSSFLNVNMSNSELELNKFMDDNCYWEWDYTVTYQDAINIEKQELMSCLYYYPLNILGNKSAPKEVVRDVKKLRKKYKK